MYRRAPHSTSGGWIICPDCEAPEERYTWKLKEGSAVFNSLSGLCKGHYRRRKWLHRFRLIPLPSGGLAQRDPRNPRYGWVICPDCEKPEERYIPIPHGGQDFERFTGRCRDCNALQSRTLTGVVPHHKTAKPINLNDRKGGDKVKFECLNRGIKPGCLGESYSPIATLFSEPSQGLCEVCFAEWLRDSKKRSGDVTLIDWRDGRPRARATLHFSQQDGQDVPVTFSGCNDVGSYSRSAVIVRLNQHLRGDRVYADRCRDCFLDPTKIIELALNTVMSEGQWKSEEFSRFLEAVTSVASRWDVVRNYTDLDFEKQLDRVTLMDVGPLLDTHQNVGEEGHNYRNRVTSKLKNRGMVEGFPAFKRAIAEGIKRGESVEDVAQRLWSERPRAKKTA
jgi:hypothetical protein